jgi:hypothetical protein
VVHQRRVAAAPQACLVSVSRISRRFFNKRNEVGNRERPDAGASMSVYSQKQREGRADDAVMNVMWFREKVRRQIEGIEIDPKLGSKLSEECLSALEIQLQIEIQARLWSDVAQRDLSPSMYETPDTFECGFAHFGSKPCNAKPSPSG